MPILCKFIVVQSSSVCSLSVEAVKIKFISVLVRSTHVLSKL